MLIVKIKAQIVKVRRRNFHQNHKCREIRTKLTIARGMSELARALTGDSAAAPAAHILEGLGADVVGRKFEGVPHTIYQELWHLAFWQQISLDWISGMETPYPATSSDGFPAEDTTDCEGWENLRARFLSGCDRLPR